ncbi:hypothetical protein [Chthonomonas calidirosea]|uniref:hypothetical protein n=1 Tax=Chthonomonas calidirosea TaxID=454171 RepID=UPI0012DD3CFD|nr:hypothetical protein [Chthonomonas calidirosea]
MIVPIAVNCGIQWAGTDFKTGRHGGKRAGTGACPYNWYVGVFVGATPLWSPDGIFHDRPDCGKLRNSIGKHGFPNGQARGPAPTIGMLMCL